MAEIKENEWRYEESERSLGGGLYLNYSENQLAIVEFHLEECYLSLVRTSECKELSEGSLLLAYTNSLTRGMCWCHLNDARIGALENGNSK